MARKRQIDPEFCTDEDMAGISRDARLFYILLWTQAEDTGVIEYKPITLKMKIFPYEEIDIMLLVEELIAKDKLIPYKNSEDREYLFIKNFHKHQTIQHPSKPKLPLPPKPYRDMIPEDILKLCSKEILSHTTTILLPYQYNRVELSRVELSRDKKEQQASPVLKTALDKVYKEGLNIYALLNKLKKESKVGAQVPEEVLLKVCTSFDKNKVDVKDTWPWFARSIAAEWETYNANQNIKEGQEWKKQPAKSIAEILRMGTVK